jgi:hypothetical protein
MDVVWCRLQEDMRARWHTLALNAVLVEIGSGVA